MYSFVIPCYNSSESIRHVVELTMEEMEKMNRREFEFVLVNDYSSSTKTMPVLKKTGRRISLCNRIKSCEKCRTT